LLYDIDYLVTRELRARIAAAMDAHIETGEMGSLGVEKSRWGRAQWIVSWLFLFVAGVLNWYAGRSGWPYLRFGRAGLNAIGGLLIMGIPWFVFILTKISHPFRRTWIRLVLLTILAIIMLVTIPATLLELPLWLADTQIRSVEMHGYRITLYQLECGVLCDFVVSVDQERVLVPPILLSQRLYIFDEAVDATIEILGKNELRVRTLPYTDKDPNIRVQEFQIKPHFFF
jgi:hypothetical protein